MAFRKIVSCSQVLNFLFIFSLIFSSSVYGQDSGTTRYYIAPDGNDSQDGSIGHPFLTLTRARDAVRGINHDMKSDIIVHIRGGIYPVSKTILFEPQDSGTGDHRIIYKAAAGETPIFTGGVPISGWVKGEGDMWKASLPRDHKLRALYVNDKRAFMASSSKITAQGGWGTYTVTAGQAPWAWESGTAADGIKYNVADLPEILRNPSDVEIENQTSWNTNFVGVREIVKEGDHYVFKFQQPYGAIAQRVGWDAGLTLQGSQIIHNAFELLKQPGQFYFDRTEQTLYYIPRPDEDMTTAHVIAPETETLLELRGDPRKNPVRNISFEGLTFAHSDYNLEEVAGSHGKATVQTATVITAFANPNWHLDLYRAYDTLPGAIIANGIDNIEFTRNTITHTGCEGIVLTNDINNTRIIGNVIRDVGGSAINLGHPQHVYENDAPDMKNSGGVGIEHEKFSAGIESAPRGVHIANNLLADDAQLFNGHTIVTVFFGQDVQIVHNWILNAPYSGINLGWSWCNFDGSASSVLPGKPTIVSKNNVIEANRIENTMLSLNDGGGIYTLGAQPGSRIDRNYVRKTQNAIYNDEGSAYFTCEENVTQSPYSFAHKLDDYGRKHSIKVDGYFVTEDKFTVTAPDCSVTGTIVCPNSQWPDVARKIIDESGLEPAFRDIVPADLQSQLTSGATAQ